MSLVRAVKQPLEVMPKVSPSERRFLAFVLMTCHFHQPDQAALHNDDFHDTMVSRLCAAVALLEQNILQTLVQALMLACANSDALETCKSASLRYPSSKWFADTRDYLQRRFDKKARGFEKSRHLCPSRDEFNYQVQTGCTVRRLYPWMTPSMCERNGDMLRAIGEELSIRSSNCTISRSSVRSHMGAANAQRIDVLGVIATKDISKGDTILQDDVVVSATNLANRCDYCCVGLRKSTTVTLSCCGVRFCSQKCAQDAKARYHLVLCGKDFSTFERRAAGTIFHIDATETLLFIRMMAAILQDVRTRPLEAPVIARLTMISEGVEPTPFKLSTCIVDLLNIAQILGINIFTEHDFDVWVLLTILYRIRSNRACQTFNNGCIASVNLLHCFFNHSCDSNTDYKVGSTQEMFSNVKIITAWQDIKKGEELTVCYTPDPHLRSTADRRLSLRPWIGGDCMCSKCVLEPPQTDRSRALEQGLPPGSRVVQKDDLARFLAANNLTVRGNMVFR